MIAPFELQRVDRLDEALRALGSDQDVHALAGGTALVLLLKQGLLRPSRLIDLSGIAELRGIRADDELRIGALTTHLEVERSEAVRRHCEALAACFASVATVRVRALATVGGNLAHADPAQDPPPMLIALGARAVLESAAGRREVAVEDLFVDVFETVLRQGELIREIVVPPMPSGSRAAYVKFLPRTEDDYATVSVGALLAIGQDGRCSDVRIALGSVGPTPVRARLAESALRGERVAPARLREAAALVRDEVDPISDARGSAGYKREMSAVWTERALRTLLP